jgi:xanthine dehydrogenase molybdopterin-binding subunit B
MSNELEEHLVEKNQDRKLNSSSLKCNTFYYRIPPCLAIAVAAVKVGRPVRLNLERHIDISITGHRHPFKIKYKVGFNNEGRFLGLDIQMWNNAGCTLDASKAVMECAMLHMGNTYQFPNIEIHGHVCRTHLPSNTGLLLNKIFNIKSK